MSRMRFNAAAVLHAAAIAAAVFVPLHASFSSPAACAEELVKSLPGGPRLVMLADRSVPMVSCTVIVAAGSAFETPATNGAAHYLEHLLFNGTTSRTREQIYAETDFLGAYNNASTQRERTVFQLLLPSENWKAGVALQSDMILRSTLPPEMFAKERGIILEELAKDRSNAGYEAEAAVSRVLWGGDARALPVLGTRESIESMSLEEVRRFYEATYRPESMTVVLMGDFDTIEAERWVGQMYQVDGAATMRNESAARPLPPRPEFPAGNTTHFVRVPGLDVVRVRVLLPMPPVASPEAVGAQLLADVLDAGEHGSVESSVERACGATLGASAAFEGGEPWSILAIAVDLPKDSGDDAADRDGNGGGAGASAVDAILAHLKAMAASADWEADVARARVARTVGEIGLREKMHYFGLERADLLGGLDPKLALEWPRRLASANVSGVRAALVTALAAPKLAVVAGGDLESAIVTAEGSAPATKAAGSAPAVPAARVAAEREDFAPVDVIPDAPRVAAPTTRRVVRDDGLTILVHATPEPRTLALHVVLRDRDRLERDGGVPFGTADVVHRAMGIATASRDKDELRGALASIGATLKVTDIDGIPYDDYYFSPEFSYARLETIDAFAPEAFALLGEVVLRPRLDAETFEAAKTAAVVRARRDAESPGGNAERLFYANVDAAHPRARSVDGDPTALAALDLDSARAHHARMTRPDRILLAISTSLPAERALELANAAFPLGATRRDEPRAPDSSAPSPGRRLPAAPTRAEIVTGREQSAIVLGTALDVDPQDEPALRVATSLLAERLADRLREREGLAYSIGASVRLDAPGRALTLQAGTRPENLESMEAGMREVARELATVEPSAEQIAGALNRAEGQTRMRRLTRIGQAYALAIAELRGRDPTRLDADLAKLREVTPAEVRRVAAQHFTLDSSITAIAR